MTVYLTWGHTINCGMYLLTLLSDNIFSKVCSVERVLKILVQSLVG